MQLRWYSDGIIRWMRFLLTIYLENYYLALSQANYTGGFPRAGFFPTSTSNLNNIAFGVDVKDPFVPKFPVLNGVNIYDPGQYALGYASTEKDGIFERDAVGDISLNKQYSVGSHSSSIEVGFKGWDARKTQVFDRENFTTNSIQNHIVGSERIRCRLDAYPRLQPQVSKTDRIHCVTRPNAFADIEAILQVVNEVWACAPWLQSRENLTEICNRAIDKVPEVVVVVLEVAQKTGHGLANGETEARFPSVCKRSIDSVPIQFCALPTEWELHGLISATLPHSSSMIQPRTLNSPKAIPPSSRLTRRTLTSWWSGI